MSSLSWRSSSSYCQMFLSSVVHRNRILTNVWKKVLTGICGVGWLLRGMVLMCWQAIRIVLLWVNNHFIDFERYPAMIAFLEQFQYSLETHKKASQLRLLHIACAAKARQRTITLTKSTREEQMNFSILGKYPISFSSFPSETLQQKYKSKY